MSDINVIKEIEGNLVILRFDGELDEQNTDETFGKIYNELGDFRDINILLDLSKLKYIDSKSIGYIADIFSKIEDDRDNKMVIVGSQPGVLDIFELVGITLIIKCFDDIDSALKYLK